MRKVIAALNMTLDGFCDHTAGLIADADLHNHFTEMLRNAGVLLYGRTTYQLMESYWPNLVKKPSGNKSDDEFALAIHNVPKIVFSRTLKKVGWETARLAKGGLKEEILALKQQPGKDICLGSRSLIVEGLNLGLVDELQLLVHPVIEGSGLPLFKDAKERNVLKLVKTKTYGSGVLALYYDPGNSQGRATQ